MQAAIHQTFSLSHRKMRFRVYIPLVPFSFPPMSLLFFHQCKDEILYKFFTSFGFCFLSSSDLRITDHRLPITDHSSSIPVTRTSSIARKARMVYSWSPPDGSDCQRLSRCGPKLTPGPMFIAICVVHLLL